MFNLFKFKKADLSSINAKLLNKVIKNLNNKGYILDTNKLASFILEEKKNQYRFFKKKNLFKKFFNLDYHLVKDCFDFSDYYFKPCPKELNELVLYFVKKTNCDRELIKQVIINTYNNRSSLYPTEKDFLKELSIAPNEIQDKLTKLVA